MSKGQHELVYFESELGFLLILSPNSTFTEVRIASTNSKGITTKNRETEKEILLLHCWTI